MTERGKMVVAAATLLTLTMPLVACTSPDATPSGTSSARIPDRTKEQNAELGRQHKTAADLYEHSLYRVECMFPCQSYPGLHQTIALLHQ